ncbi:uncharacterized protein At2g29880-like isoform X2 [Lotus japonicus]|uniref:uncharacterized protein At2g29880-like isoform X2 n=1 Tax=Lotus japonicus TaxID=34305 RepID=UPI002587A3AC|nr:uncharacterized protein At2g29880-like isoform X2 [Lotus japonicus]
MASEATQQAAKVKVERRAWSDEEFNALLDYLEEAVANNKRCDAGQFKNGTFKWLEQKLEAKFPTAGIKVKPHIESIIRRLKNEYKELYDMLNTSGFGWDDVNKKIHVDSDDVWNAYIQANKKDNAVKNYRNKVFPHFNRMVVIFGKDRANGKSAEDPTDVVEDLDKETNTHGNNTTDEHMDEVIGLSDDDIQDVTQAMSNNQNRGKEKITHSESRRVRKRLRGEDLIATSMDKFANQLVEVVGKSADRMGDMAESVKCMAEGVKVVKDFYNDSRAIPNELMKMEGLTSRERNKAGRLLMQNLPLVHLFWGFQGEHRVQFVRDLLEDN